METDLQNLAHISISFSHASSSELDPEGHLSLPLFQPKDK